MALPPAGRAREGQLTVQSSSASRPKRNHCHTSTPERHAGLPDGAAGAISSCTAPGRSDEQLLDAAIADYLDALQAFNVEMNGERPSATFDGADDVPRSLAYATSEVDSMLRKAGAPERAELVAVAWNMVLAGDFDDVAADARQELAATDFSGTSRTPMDDDELEEIRARLREASPGPWTAFTGGGLGGPEFIRISEDDAEPDMYVERDGAPASSADLRFIASARQDIPRLLAEVEREKGPE